jgi:hypothetical protein
MPLHRVVGSSASQHLWQQRSDFSFTLLSGEDERRRCPNEKAVGDAQYAKRGASGARGRRGRQHLSLLRLILAQDDPSALLTASANRAHHGDSTRDDHGADSSAQNDP